MIDKTRRIGNPLNLIKYFLLFAISLFFSTKFLKEENQFIVVCFVMGYVLLLTLLTFLIILIKPAVLYSPQDFKNENNFLNLLKAKKKENENGKD